MFHKYSKVAEFCASFFLNFFSSVVRLALIMCFSFCLFSKRSESLCQLPWEHKTSKGQFSHLSLPVLLDFESFLTDHGGIPDMTPPREWVRNIWDTWFDEVFPPLENIQGSDPLPAALEANQLPQDEDKLDMCEVLDKGLSTADLEHEVAKLTQTLTECGNRNAFDRCRRGALYIKLGYLDQALEDLSAVRLIFLYFIL